MIVRVEASDKEHERKFIDVNERLRAENKKLKEEIKAFGATEQDRLFRR